MNISKGENPAYLIPSYRERTNIYYRPFMCLVLYILINISQIYNMKVASLSLLLKLRSNLLRPHSDCMG